MPDNKNDDMIYNWSNTLRTSSNQGERIAAAQAARAHKSNGFSIDEVIDLLIADNYDIRTAQIAVDEAFPSAEEALEPRVSNTVSNVMVVPTSYKEMAPVVESTLNRLSSRDFVDKLVRGAEPLVPVSHNMLHSWYRLAQFAKCDGGALAQLHKELEPFLAEALYNSVLASEYANSKMVVAGNHGSIFSVQGVRGNTYNVNIEDGTCNCRRFQDGNFADFGLACEHMVLVADSISPHQRLVRAMR